MDTNNMTANNAINTEGEKRRAFVTPLFTAGYGERFLHAHWTMRLLTVLLVLSLLLLPAYAAQPHRARPGKAWPPPCADVRTVWQHASGDLGPARRRQCRQRPAWAGQGEWQATP
jgi:hypothetical protein